MLKTARSAGGKITAVIHCAGVIRDGLIRSGGAAAGCAEVWNTKALSAWWLHKHTSGDVLDCFLVFSSVTAAIGSIGQSAYGAANRFLDSLMDERRRAGTKGLSIQWPAVSGVGMAASALSKELSVGDASAWSIKPGEFCTTLRLALSGQPSLKSPLAVLPKGSLLWLEGRIVEQFQAVREPLAPAAVSTEPARGTAASNAAAQVTTRLHSIVETFLGRGDFADDTPLMDIGLDSIGATDLAYTLADEFGVHILSTFIFKYPTVKDIAGHLLSLLGNTESSMV
jgi:acyl carrier protein